jgi:hypothetical protein
MRRSVRKYLSLPPATPVFARRMLAVSRRPRPRTLWSPLIRCRTKFVLIVPRVRVVFFFLAPPVFRQPSVRARLGSSHVGLLRAAGNLTASTRRRLLPSLRRLACGSPMACEIFIAFSAVARVPRGARGVKWGSVGRRNGCPVCVCVCVCVCRFREFGRRAPVRNCGCAQRVNSFICLCPDAVGFIRRRTGLLQ